MRWDAIRTIVAVVGLVVIAGGIVFSAGIKDHTAQSAVEKVNAVEARVDARLDKLEDRERARDTIIARMDESIKWIRDYLTRESRAPPVAP